MPSPLTLPPLPPLAVTVPSETVTPLLLEMPLPPSLPSPPAALTVPPEMVTPPSLRMPSPP